MSTVREFRPELLSRRGEYFAWSVSVGMITALTIGSISWGSLPFFYWAFSVFLLFTAASISLGNWMDRRAVLRMDSDGIHFENGLRLVRLMWPEVQNVAVVPTRLGKRVQVQSAQSHFTFKTMGESSWGGKLFRTGFAAGDEILKSILKECQMTMMAKKDGMLYYARA